MFVLLSTFALLIHFLLFVSPTSPCSTICPPYLGTMAEKRCSQQYLFTGRILHEVTPSSNPDSTYEFKVRVLNSYRNPGVHAILPGSTVILSTPLSFSSCGVTPNIGGNYLLGTDDFVLNMDNSAGQGESSSVNNEAGTFTIRLVCDTFEVITEEVQRFLDDGACE